MVGCLGHCDLDDLGANRVSPCHHAAAKPLAVARSPYAQTAARIRAAWLNGRSSTKKTPREHRRQWPARTRSTASGLRPTRRA